MVQAKIKRLHDKLIRLHLLTVNGYTGNVTAFLKQLKAEREASILSKHGIINIEKGYIVWSGTAPNLDTAKMLREKLLDMSRTYYSNRKNKETALTGQPAPTLPTNLLEDCVMASVDGAVPLQTLVNIFKQHKLL
jgi:hypothetical protein